MSSMSAEDQSNIYGQTKLSSEKIVKSSGLQYLILRPSLILGYSPNTTNDRPFNRILKNIDQQIPAVYDSIWKFQPTYIGHISEVIRTCIEKNVWNESIAIATPELTSRFQSASDILKYFKILVTRKNDVSTAPLITDSLLKLHQYNLPSYSYNTMITQIVKEIKNRTLFILP
jgi:NADH dehydrogenase